MQTPPPTASADAPRPWWRGRLLGLYLLLVLTLPLLRLAHCWPVAATSWWWVMCPLWLPWVLALIGSLVGLLVRRRQNKAAQ